jgi:hypothetical protein
MLHTMTYAKLLCLVAAVPLIGCASGGGDVEGNVNADTGTAPDTTIAETAVDSGTPETMADTTVVETAPDTAIYADMGIDTYMPPTCTDMKRNGSETDVDCGGAVCPKCPVDKGCSFGSDCDTGICGTSGKCAAPSCTDMLKNGKETDLDCGGPDCPKCGDTKTCTGPTDCASGICTSTKCATPTCIDTVKNGSETDIDCGGTACPKCITGLNCKENTDCVSGICSSGTCVTPLCTDKVKNGTETDVDCGGATCGPCSAGKDCILAGDCVSLACTSGKCQGTCTDKEKNGSETDVDCGGGTCPSCAIGKACAGHSDCLGSLCDSTTGMCDYAKSCKALHDARPTLGSNVYTINPGGTTPFPVHCDMVTNGGGWTLALKANGGLPTFGYNQAIWTNAVLYQTDKPGFDDNEAKLETWNSVPFGEILIGLRQGTSTRYAVLGAAASSLYNAFVGGIYSALPVSRVTWKGLLASSSLQPNCNKAGINVLADPGWPDPGTVPELARVRIGILGNNEADCQSPDSFIGIGGRANVCTVDSSVTVGNVAGCGGDIGTDPFKAIAFGYVYVR